MVQVTVHVGDVLEATWMCPDCKQAEGPLEAQDEFVWRRKGMTKEEALVEMVREHRKVHAGAVLTTRERSYLEVA